MDDILKSIRRIIRSDQEETSQETKPIQEVVTEDKPRSDDDNLIRMKIHDQKRLRILEKKLQTIETEYEQKLQLHRRKMTDYRRQNQELSRQNQEMSEAAEAYRSKLDLVSSSLKTAHDCLEKLQVRNKALKNKVLQMARFEQGTAVLKTIQREFSNLYHPDQVAGDNISRSVRHEVYNEFSQVLQGVQSRFQSRRM